MCSTCCCPTKCSCNTTCCFGFIIPVGVGTVFAALWVLFNGLTFPAMCFLFWPLDYIMIPSCAVAAATLLLGLTLIINMKLKYQILFRIVVHGLFAVYAFGCVVTIIGLNVDQRKTHKAFIDTMKVKFSFSVSESTAYQMIQSLQIVYYTYIFFSYVYCGMVFQIYERSLGKKLKEYKRHRRETIVKKRDLNVQTHPSKPKYDNGQKKKNLTVTFV